MNGFALYICLTLNNKLKYQTELERIQGLGELRTLPDYSLCSIDFVSNDYLGLGKVNLELNKTLTQSGMGSRLIAGNSLEAIHCEFFLAQFYDSDAALVFNSGYTANLGVLSTIPKKDEVVFYDQLSHASIRDGLRLSRASSYSFLHNDHLDLEKKLIRFAGKNATVVVEACYSMDGDFADLEGIFNLATKYGAHVVIDEAHSIGIYGELGKGCAFEYANHPNLLCRIITFGKALGAHGAAVLCSNNLKDYLIHACRPFIYTTALPPEQYLRIVSSVQFSEKMKHERSQLMEICLYFSEIFGVPISHIQNIPVSSIEKIKALTKLAVASGISLKGVWSPTVPNGNECLRISLHSYNTKAEIDELRTLLNNFQRA